MQVSLLNRMSKKIFLIAGSKLSLPLESGLGVSFSALSLLYAIRPDHQCQNKERFGPVTHEKGFICGK
jgi:hypothetical protein